MENVPLREANESRVRNIATPAPTERPTEPARAEPSREDFAGGASLAEAIGGAAVAVLAVIALAGMLPMYLAPIAVIILGVTLLLDGFGMTARSFRLLAHYAGPRVGGSEFGGGMTVEGFGGAAGIVLGILALVGTNPLALVSISLIVFGAALLLSAGTRWRYNHLAVEGWTAGNETARTVAGTMLSSACGGQVLIGLGVVILGILALAGLHSMILNLVGLLCLGAAVQFLSGSVAGRMMAFFQD